MSTTHTTSPVDEHRRRLAHALNPYLEDAFDGALSELRDYIERPTSMKLDDAANLLIEAEQKIRALQALAHSHGRSSVDPAGGVNEDSSLTP